MAGQLFGPHLRVQCRDCRFQFRCGEEYVPASLMVVCPNCGTSWVLEEMDCVFGMARKEGNDVIVLVRCLGCRLPHSARAVGFVTAYPRVIQLMEGWSEWEKREQDFRAQELKLYGAETSAS